VVDLSSQRIEFGVVHLGDHNVACGVRPRGDDEAYAPSPGQLERHFDTADFPEIIRAVDDHLGSHPYSLRTLFRDEQRRILDTLLRATLEEAENLYRGIYRTRAPLMRFLADVGATIPAPLLRAAEVVLNADLRTSFASSNVDPGHVRSLLAEAERFDVPSTGPAWPTRCRPPSPARPTASGPSSPATARRSHGSATTSGRPSSGSSG
jgi:hypothetical protein